MIGGHTHVHSGPDVVEGDNGATGYTWTNGTTGGAAYAIAASGLVLTYSTTRVFNIAHGAFGMVLSFVFWDFSVRQGMPRLLALALVLFVVAAVDLIGDDPEPHLALRFRRVEADIEKEQLIEDAVLTLAPPDEPALTASSPG